MQESLTLIKTKYYADVFPALIDSLFGRVNSLHGKNLIFCEEKSSLMVENAICSAFNGSFNTDVYSFGKYLKKFSAPFNAISKEGSAMAVKYVLSKSDLTAFSASKQMLAPSLYELIIQLKSAKVTPNQLFKATEKLKGSLKNKIYDVATVFSGYENFLRERNLVDSGSSLEFLPEILENDQKLKETDVFLVGYSSFTAQARQIISVLIKKAKSVTIILTAGDADVYLNETFYSFIELASLQKKQVKILEYESPATKEAELVLNELFKPFIEVEQVKTDKIYLPSCDSAYTEIEFIAEKIKEEVLSGRKRYLDFTIALSSLTEYSEIISEVFTRLDIPFYIDEKKKVSSHPLIKLVLSYLTAFQNNLERNALLSFAKNPLIISDINLSDKFENYVYKYNVNYSRFNSPFTYGEPEEVEVAESVRKQVIGYFNKFSIKDLLVNCRAEEKLKEHSQKLLNLKEYVESAVNDQVYNFVTKLIEDMDFILKGEALTVKEIKELFLSGANSGELSIIPQHLDAVFVGLYKNTALARAKYLFAPGLSSLVPAVKEDLALLTDSDIVKLKDSGVIVEPKIKHVNRRAVEETAQALSAFTEKLYLSCPTCDLSGEPIEKSQILILAEKLFTINSDCEIDGFYTIGQGLLSYAKNCSDFIDGESSDFTVGASFYKCAKERVDFSTLHQAGNREVKLWLDRNREIIAINETSPTTIEEYNLCPYKAFLSRGLNLEPRKTGGLDRLFLGVLEHGVLENYVNALFIKKEKQIASKAESDAFVNEIIENLKKQEDFSFFNEDEVSQFKLNGAIEEIKEFCYKLNLNVNNSLFKPYETEIGFGLKGKGKTLSPITLKNGAIKLCGKIDRIDKYKDYYRIIDYKTGSVSIEEKNLFSGKKLQLYLYALALTEGKLAGVYYSPINESAYSNDKPLKNTMVGKTLNEKEAVFAQDLNFEKENKSSVVPVVIKGDEIVGALSEDAISAYVEYAKKVGEKSAERIIEGTIVPSPLENICEYCPFTSVCDGALFARKIKEVDQDVIIKSARGEEK